MSVQKLTAGKHTCLGQLSDGAASTDSKRLERPAMLVYCGKFESMDGPVEITEEHIDKLVENHNAKHARLSQGSTDALAFERSMPPVQLDHSTSARDTVGRVTGRLSKGEYLNEVGEKVPALHIDRLAILGQDNVERVQDGRWSNLSIGADLEAGTLNELTITPFPAAPNASLLGKFRLMKEIAYKGATIFVNQDKSGQYEAWVHSDQIASQPHVHYQTEAEAVEKCKALIEDLLVKNKVTSLSEGETMPTETETESKEQIKARHLEEKQALSSSHAEELKGHKLEEVKGKHEEQLKKLTEKHAEELKKLGIDPEAMSDDVSEEDKKLASEKAEQDKEEKEVKDLSKRMSAAKPKIVALSKSVSKGLKANRLAAREQVVMAKIARLRASAKMTPAEQKKLNITELAGKSEAEFESFFKGYEIRENVIDTRFHGTTKALSLASLERLSSGKRKVRLEAEARHDMGLPMNDEHKKAMEEEKQSMSGEAPVMPAHEGNDEMMCHLEKMLGSYDQRDAVMAHVKKMMDMKHLGEMSPEHAESAEKQMSALVKNIEQLHTDHQNLISMIGDAAGIKPAELTE